MIEKIKIRLIVAMAMLLVSSSNLQSAIGNFTLSTAVAQTCDSVIVNFTGTHVCPNDVITGITHSLSGSDITITLNVTTGFCIPPTVQPTFSANYTLALSALTSGNYTVKAQYNSFSSSINRALKVDPCCPVSPEAGPDTSFCNETSFQLNANIPALTAIGLWTVLTGNGSLNNALIPNAIVSNLSSGPNILEWKMTDTATACSVSDTIIITNDQLPGTSVTEADRFSCTDTTTVKANAPIIGSGLWTSLGQNLVLSAANPNCPVIMTSLGVQTFIWTITNGQCKDIDTLKINNVAFTDTPSINYSNGVLTSTMAAAYQWYLNDSIIAGATSQNYTPSKDGVYKVFTSELDCFKGLYSNMIEVEFVGIKGYFQQKEILIYPNPSTGRVFVSGVDSYSDIFLFDQNMRAVASYTLSNGKQELDLSGMNPGFYFIKAIRNEKVFMSRIVLSE